MISFSTIVPDGTDPIIIKENKKSVLQKATARISRVKTLDGNSFVSHRGYTDTDRTLNVNARLSKADANNLWTLFTDEILLNVSTIDGCYSGVIDTLSIDNGEIKMKILITERISA